MSADTRIAIPHWHILGIGALGGLFAQRLSEQGHGVTVLNRLGCTEALQLTFNDNGAMSKSLFSQSPCAASDPIDFLWVSTKAFDAQGAVNSVAHRLTPTATVVLSGNGMGYQELIANSLETDNIIVCSTTAGCTIDAAGHWRPAGVGETQLGWLQSREAAPDWMADFERAPWQASWRSDISALLLTKLAINCAINPMTALYDVNNGAVLEAPLRPEFDQAVSEITTRLRWAGHAALAENLAAIIEQVAEQTGANCSSMRRDWQRKRPTEVEAILGFFLEQLIPIEDTNNLVTPPAPVLSRWLTALRQGEANLE